MTRFTGTDVVCFRAERIVFEGLNFALEPGGALILRGANGSGKSSLLRLMAGLGRPLSGTIAWHEADIADDPEAHNRHLHYVGHADPVKPVLTVAENLAFWAALRVQADTAGGTAGAVAEALERLGIGHLASVPGRFLSAGQKRRVNLARVLTAKADLWLLDEPQTALDSQAVKSLDAVIADHRRDGGMVVVSSHAEAGLKDAVTLDLGDFQGQLSETAS
ncbi:MAG: heme ABC transporter ATP-binding protein CcmA [Rhodospirillaceae bacterium]|nr:heme ABC transporter ATP-binding protein CcmA [Rhodospirillaceae bacterium]